MQIHTNWHHIWHLLLLKRRSGFSAHPLRSRFISGFMGAGGTGIAPATCGFGALGALSSVV
jgi:hypothetical protein